MGRKKKVEPSKRINLTFDKREVDTLYEAASVIGIAPATLLVKYLRDINIFQLFTNMAALIKEAQLESDYFKSKFDGNDELALQYIVNHLSKDLDK